MRYPFIFFFASFIFISCFSNNYTIRGINLRENISSKTDPKAYELSKGRSYYYYKDYTIFVLGKVVTHEEFLTDSFGYSTPVSEMKMRIQYVYYVCKKKQPVCVCYENESDTSGEKMNKDSIINKYGLRTYDFLKPGNVTLVSNTSLSKETILRKYATSHKENFTFSDSIYCYFSKKLNKIPFSYSKELDSIVGMKLYKIEIIHHELYKKLPQDSIRIPRIVREEMNEINVDNKELIKSLCQRFEKDVLK